MTTRSLWVHEDEDAMRCLWPASTVSQVAGEVQASIAAATRNRAVDGVGYNDMHLIKSPDASFADEGLTRSAVMARLADIMPRFERIQVGDGKYFGFVDEDALCFGFDSTCFIYGGVRDGLVHSVSFNAWTNDPEQLGALRRAIEAVDALCPAALVDYWIKMAGLVSDHRFMDTYIAAVAGRIENPDGFDAVRNASRIEPH